MASKIGMTYRNEVSQNRVNAALERMVSELGVEVEPFPDGIRDLGLREALRLEWTADVLERLVEAVEPSDDSDDVQIVEAIDLRKLKRPELNQLAAELGIEEPEVMPNIAAVIEAIESTATPMDSVEPSQGSDAVESDDGDQSSEGSDTANSDTRDEVE